MIEKSLTMARFNASEERFSHSFCVFYTNSAIFSSFKLSSINIYLFLLFEFSLWLDKNKSDLLKMMFIFSDLRLIDIRCFSELFCVVARICTTWDYIISPFCILAVYSSSRKQQKDFLCKFIQRLLSWYIYKLSCAKHNYYS